MNTENKPFYVRKRTKANEETEKVEEKAAVEAIVDEKEVIKQEKNAPKEEKDGISLKKPKRKREIAKKTEQDALILAKEDIKKARKRKEKEAVLPEIGLKSEEVLSNDKKEKKLPKKDEENTVYDNFIKKKEVLLGVISAIEDGDRDDSFNIIVNWNGLRVIIPDFEYFEDKFNFGANYDELPNAAAKTRKRKIIARYHTGAEIYFIIKSIGKDTYGQYFAVASRREAMAAIRDEWFLHSNPDKIYEHTAKIGDIAPAHVIAVVENAVLVECLGVETRIDANTLTSEYVENCKDFVSPGDTIEVRIRKLYTNDGVYLAVNGRLNDSEGVIRTMKVKSNYLGTVDRYNKAKDMYIIRLNNGVNANVYSKSVIGADALYTGQKVQVYVYSIMQNYVVGSAYII